MYPIREYVAHGFETTKNFFRRGKVVVDYSLYVLHPTSHYDNTNIIEGEIVEILDDSNYQRGYVRALPSEGGVVQELVVMIAEDTSDKLVNINTASIGELSKLPGIGISTAKNIVDYRKEHGNFRTIYEILNVYGIAGGKFQEIADHITVNSIY